MKKILRVNVEYTTKNYNGTHEPLNSFENESDVYNYLYSLLKKDDLKELKFFDVYWIINSCQWITYHWNGKQLENKYGRTLLQDKYIHVQSEYEYDMILVQ